MKDFLLRFPAKMSRWYGILLLLLLEVLFMWAFNGMFPFSIPKIQQISGGLGIPDSELYYSFTQLSMMFDKYGANGREAYLNLQWIDMLYPVVYSLLLGSILYFLYKRSRFQWVVLIPLFAAIFDYLENIMLRINVLTFPNMNDVMVSMSSIATFMKWSLLIVSIFLLIPGFTARITLWNIHRKRKSLA